VSKSKVWFHFTKSKEENDHAVCTTCNNSVKVKDVATTNLHKHLKRHHGIELETISAKKKTITAAHSSVSTSPVTLD